MKTISILAGVLLMLCSCSKTETSTEPGSADQSRAPYSTAGELLSAAGIETGAGSRDIAIPVPGYYNIDCLPNVAPTCCFSGPLCYVIVIGGTNKSDNEKSGTDRVVINTDQYIPGQLTQPGQPPVFQGEIVDPVYDPTTGQIISAGFKIQ